MTLNLDELERLEQEATAIAALRNAASALLAAARERDRLAAELAETREREARLHRLAWAATRVVEGWGDADRIENNEQARRCDELEATVKALTAATDGEGSEGGTAP